MPTRKPESVKNAVVAKRLQGDSKRQIARDLDIHRATVDNILDESQVEEALAQCRRDYLQLAPTALNVVKKALAQATDAQEIDRDQVGTALQVLKGTGIHEERTRSRSDVRITDHTSESNEQLIDSVDQLLRKTQPPKPS
jgi:transposase